MGIRNQAAGQGQRSCQITRIAKVSKNPPSARGAKLTQSELQVLSYAVAGHRAKQIAELTGRSPRTVHYHLDSAYGKLGVKNIVQAAIVARDLNILNDAEAHIVCERGVKLTSQESHALRLLDKGLSAKVIAEIMEVSPRTVHFHLANIYEKFGVQSRVQALVAARQEGLIS